MFLGAPRTILDSCCQELSIHRLGSRLFCGEVPPVIVGYISTPHLSGSPGHGRTHSTSLPSTMSDRMLSPVLASHTRTKESAPPVTATWVSFASRFVWRTEGDRSRAEERHDVGMGWAVEGGGSVNCPVCTSRNYVPRSWTAGLQYVNHALTTSMRVKRWRHHVNTRAPLKYRRGQET